MSCAKPEVVAEVAALRQRVAEARAGGLRIGFVPTMGALHEGHLSLARASQAECGFTVASIYVNPTQFSPEEDLDRYPRTRAADVEALAGCGVALVLAPDNAVMYPKGFDSWVEVGAAARPLEGRSRPGHFRGVTTVVLKLFNMVQPDAAYFGQKDYQQALVIRRMVEDLNVPLVVRVCPTVREPDGLAMSSRNRYLSAEDRRRAVVLWQSLCLAQELVGRRERDAASIERRMRDRIEGVPGVEIDYLALVDPETLAPVERIAGPTLAALAVRLGGTRLIDNHLLQPTPG